MHSDNLSIAGVLVASLCAAVLLTVTLSGHPSGNFIPLNTTTPQGFVNTPFTFSFTTDTTAIDTGGNVYQTAFAPGAVLINGMSGAFSTGVAVQVDNPYVNLLIQTPGGYSAVRAVWRCHRVTISFRPLVQPRWRSPTSTQAFFRWVNMATCYLRLYNRVQVPFALVL